FDTEALTPAEVVMGVDGKLSAGYTPVPTKQNISLQADSDSNLIFEAWHLAQQTAKEVYFASAIVRLPSVSKSYVLTNGVLTSYMPIPDAKKILQPRKFQITWESVVGAPI
ncbi:phage tail fiber protein, partial [Burkholderia multivorans]